MPSTMNILFGYEAGPIQWISYQHNERLFNKKLRIINIQRDYEDMIWLQNIMMSLSKTILLLLLMDQGQGHLHQAIIMYMECMRYWQGNKRNPTFVNPLCAKFFRSNINMYLQFILFLHNEWTDN